MIKTALAAMSLAAAVAATPAAAVTNVTFTYLGSGNVTGTSVVRTDGATTATATAVTFGTAPALLTNVSDFTAAQTRTTDNGLGVFGGAGNNTIDTNTARREAIVLTSNRFMRLSGAVLNSVDGNDSLGVFGVNRNTGALVPIGYGGVIISGLGGAASFVNTSVAGTTTTLNFVSPSASYRQFVFTTRTDGFTGPAQAYRVAALSFAVPEPQTWAMMIAGFGLIGVAMRRRGRAASA